ncbi:olfactory receptor 1f45-like [Pleurodeles waltl]|uniref:olfactory receptor 1f45-like n=1 Tax=Pleurodeles waltl TaxID=8319 RepID=UPI0037098CCB
MDKGNQSTVTEFILFGFSDLSEHQKSLFVMFLIMYILTLFGNVVLITLIVSNPRLHTPMYYLLCCLSVVDISFTSTTIPKLLYDLLHEVKTISFGGCFTQLFFFHSIGNMDSFLLVLMAYDRYVAICQPLHYTMLMSKKLCSLLITGSYVIACLHSLLYTLWTSKFKYCGSNNINHFFCDAPPLINLSCSDLTIFTFTQLIEGGIVLCLPFLCIAVSYAHIATSIMKMATAVAKHKAFSTCSSHIAVVTLFYGSTVAVYIRLPSTRSLDSDRFISVIYIVVTPMLNPFIYSLRNKEVKVALKKAFSR